MHCGVFNFFPFAWQGTLDQIGRALSILIGAERQHSQ
jgi:hypothetical protein